MTETLATLGSQTPEDDALDLTLRLVLHVFERVFEAKATATWSAPGAVVLLGGSPGGPALAVPTRWGAKVAGRPRDDGRLRVSAVHRHTDELLLDLATGRPETVPEWASAIPGLAATLVGRGSGGASLIAYMDVPDESGIMAGAALNVALARAVTLADEADPSGLLAALAVEGLAGGLAGAAHATSLLGRSGQVLVLSRGPTGPRHVAFDPAEAGLRLALMSARPGMAVAPMRQLATPASDAGRVPPAAEAIERQDWPALGAMLTASHEAGAAGRERVEADLLVECALAASGIGGRATSSTTALALVPARSLRDLRSIAARAFAAEGRPAPRMLTTGAFPPAVARPESLLGT